MARRVERAPVRRGLVEAVRRVLGRLRLGPPGRVLAEIELELLLLTELLRLFRELLAAGRVVAAVGEAAALLLELLLRRLLEPGFRHARIGRRIQESVRGRQKQEALRYGSSV